MSIRSRTTDHCRTKSITIGVFWVFSSVVLLNSAVDFVAQRSVEVHCHVVGFSDVKIYKIPVMAIKTKGAQKRDQ